MITQDEMLLLELLKAGFNQEAAEQVNISEDAWYRIFEMARGQGVLPLVLQGSLAVKKTMPKELQEKWRSIVIGMVLRNERILAVQDKLVHWLEEAGILCAILKGSSVSVYYPRTELRPMGDVDVLIPPEDYERAIVMMNQRGYFASDAEHPFHSDFIVEGVVVELHYAVSTFPDLPGSRRAEQIMKDCLTSRRWISLERHEFPVLADVHQALSLLLHIERHMADGGVGLRQLCDWMMLVVHMPQEAFVRDILPVCKTCGLDRFAKLLTKTCSCFLGVKKELVGWCWDVADDLPEIMMEEMLRTGNFGRAKKKDDASELFAQRDGAERTWSVMFHNLNSLAKEKLPIAGNIPVLLPLVWFYLIVRYWLRSLCGIRPKKYIKKTVTVTRRQKRLYQQLRLFKG